MKKIKKIILSILLVLGFTSCGYHNSMSDSVKFQIVDTLEIFNESNPFAYTNYSVIIKMDSSYYSAKVDRFGQLYEITRQLKIKK